MRWPLILMAFGPVPFSPPAIREQAGPAPVRIQGPKKMHAVWYHEPVSNRHTVCLANTWDWFRSSRKPDPKLNQGHEPPPCSGVTIGFAPELEAIGPERDWTPEAAGAQVVATLRDLEQNAIDALGRELYAEAGRQLLLSTIDELWTDHLSTLERVDEGIGLRSYAELDPLVEYRREAGLLFQDLLREIRLETAARTCAFAVEEAAAEVDIDNEPLLPSQRRQQRRTLKR